MKCQNCLAQAAPGAKYCTACGSPIYQDSAVPQPGSTRTATAEPRPSGSISVSDRQDVETVGPGGSVVGAIFGGSGGPTHVGGQKHYHAPITSEHVGGDKFTVGNITGGTTAIGRGAQAVADPGSGGDETARAFAMVYQVIDERADEPDVDKPDLIHNVRAIELELSKSENLSTRKLERSLRWIADAAPDILDATLSAIKRGRVGLSSPLLQIVSEFRKPS